MEKNWYCLSGFQYQRSQSIIILSVYHLIFHPTCTLEYLSIITYPGNIVSLRQSLSRQTWFPQYTPSSLFSLVRTKFVSDWPQAKGCIVVCYTSIVVCLSSNFMRRNLRKVADPPLFLADPSPWLEPSLSLIGLRVIPH